MSSAIIQARFGEDTFPISRFILERARDLGLTRMNLIRRFGYRDLGKGHRALSELLTTGMVPPLAAKHLANALEVDQGIVDAVILATTQQQHDIERAAVLAQDKIYRAAFRPHLQVQTERQVPSPIWLAAIMGVARLRIVPLPKDAFGASGHLRTEIVKDMIVEHYRRQDGQIAGFAAITGYVLVLVIGYDGFDFGIPYDVNGLPTTQMCSVQRLPTATLGLKRNDDRLSGLLRRTNSGS
jgi:hypothetical protein